jgi:site-specific DNA recombinase
VPGEHEAIVDRCCGTACARSSARARASAPCAHARFAEGPDLRSDRQGDDPAHTRKGCKLYRYYVSTAVLKRDADFCPIRRVPAGEIEAAVIDQLRGLLRAPEIIVRTWRAARQAGEEISEAEVRDALTRLDPLWDELFPAEQARIAQLLVERVDIHAESMNVRLRG